MLDGTKFIAAASKYEGEPWDLITKGVEVKEALELLKLQPEETKNEAANFMLKLQEEVEEYLRDKNEEELADILEVLDAIIEENHFSWENILEIKRAKKKAGEDLRKKSSL